MLRAPSECGAEFLGVMGDKRMNKIGLCPKGASNLPQGDKIPRDEMMNRVSRIVRAK